MELEFKNNGGIKPGTNAAQAQANLAAWERQQAEIERQRAASVLAERDQLAARLAEARTRWQR